MDFEASPLMSNLWYESGGKKGGGDEAADVTVARASHRSMGAGERELECISLIIFSGVFQRWHQLEVSLPLFNILFEPITITDSKCKFKSTNVFHFLRRTRQFHETPSKNTVDYYIAYISSCKTALSMRNAFTKRYALAPRRTVKRKIEQISLQLNQIDLFVWNMSGHAQCEIG